jgi:1,3-propanediol dehydrogenase/alcohol dehydrogenase
MAWPLGAYFHVPHGLANAIALPRAMEFTRVAAPDKFAQIARAMGEEIANSSSVQAAQEAVESVKRLRSDIQVSRLSNLGIKKEEYEKVIVQMAEDGLAFGTPQVNPRVSTEKEIIELFKLVYD